MACNGTLTIKPEPAQISIAILFMSNNARISPNGKTDFSGLVLAGLLRWIIMDINKDDWRSHQQVTGY